MQVLTLLFHPSKNLLFKISSMCPDRLHSGDDIEGEDDMRSEYTCPFCYEDYDIATLCSHLEDEHSYESNPAACPVCAAKISRDIVGHVTLQHGHLFKMQRRRRSRRTDTSSNPSFLSLPVSEDASAKSYTSNIQQNSSIRTSLDSRQKAEAEALRVEFVQSLLLSLIFPEN